MAKLKTTCQSLKKLIPLNILIALFFFVSGMAALNNEEKRVYSRVLGLQIEEKANQETIYSWEQIIKERPNYRDGWLQLAVLYYKSSDFQKAKQALDQARQLDPNNKDLLKLQKLWGD